MDEYLCVTLLSKPDESEADFKARLSTFWTHLLRQHLAVFEKVYAETSAFEQKGNRSGRKYLVEADAVGNIEEQLRIQAMEFEPVDADDVYSKFEAAPPDWFWIEH